MGVEAQKQHANSLSRDDLVLYLAKVHASTLEKKEKIELVEHCEERIVKLDRNTAMVEEADMSDLNIMEQ